MAFMDDAILGTGDYSRSMGQNQDNQQAPGRDVAAARRRSQPRGQANINTAISGMPVGGVTPFAGAQQTIGAQAPQAQQTQSQAPAQTGGVSSLGTMGVSGLAPSAGQSGIASMDPAGQATPVAAAPEPRKFNLDGAQVNGRAADLNDLHDLTMLASQQQGFHGVGNNDAARRSFEEFIKPLFAQQGREVELMEHNRLDKFRDKKTGHTVDFVAGAGGNDPRFAAMIEDGSAPQGGAGIDIASAISGQQNPFAGQNVLGQDSNQIWQNIMKALQGQPQLAAAARSFQ
jgi:hypothetical protein